MFNIGDLVVCIYNEDIPEIKLGKEYIVTDVLKSSDYIRIEYNSNDCYHSDRFHISASANTSKDIPEQEYKSKLIITDSEVKL